MKTKFLPKTRLGKWSMWFGAGFIAYMVFVSPIMMALNQQTADWQVWARPITIAIGLLVMASGLGAFITGFVSFFKYKERAVLIYITIFIGLLAVIFLLGEFYSRIKN
ncbi:MAG: hypothetical protein V1712_03505 [Patescibacteria group bacterium]